MNKRQKAALWIGVLVAVAMFLYPPWQTRAGGASKDDGYALLFAGPVDYSRVEDWERQREEILGETGSTQGTGEKLLEAVRLRMAGLGERPEPRRLINSDLNYRRLLAQWLLVAIVTGAALATFREGTGR